MKLYSENPDAHVSMRRDAALDAVLTQVMRGHGVRYVVETGTFLGTGSTTALAEALLRSQATQPRLHTIEVNWAHHAHARAHLAQFPFVTCHWGLSVPLAAATAFIKNDAILTNHHAEPDVYIDNTADPRRFYLDEVQGQIEASTTTSEAQPSPTPPDNVLVPLLESAPASGSLVLLDSAGGIGLLEYQLTLAAMKGKRFLLLLDDTGHIKHYRSKRHVEDSGEFNIIARGDGRDWLLAESRITV